MNKKKKKKRKNMGKRESILDPYNYVYRAKNYLPNMFSLFYGIFSKILNFEMKVV